VHGATLVPAHKIALQHKLQDASCHWSFSRNIFATQSTGTPTHSVHGARHIKAMRYFSSMNVMENLHSTGTADDTVDIRKTSHGTLDW
jgi:hypothetical protein